MLMAKHHTISYKSSSRMWSTLLDCGEFYRSVLLREHFMNLSFLRKFLRENYTSIFLLLTILIATLFKSILLICPYIILVFSRSIINMRKEVFRIPGRTTYFIIRDLSIWVALFLFWPKEITNYEYRKINDCND